MLLVWPRCQDEYVNCRGVLHSLRVRQFRVFQYRLQANKPRFEVRLTGNLFFQFGNPSAWD